jgi:hypothetical protein
LISVISLEQSIAWLPASAGRTTPAHNFRLKAEATGRYIHRLSLNSVGRR